jgi:hypothetical protein
MDLRRCQAIVLLTLLSISYGCWLSVGLAAELPSTPVADTLSDRAADQLSVIEPSLVLAAPISEPAPMQIPVGKTGGDEQRGDTLVPVPRMMSDSISDPAKQLDPAGVVLSIQSHLLSSKESVSEVSALSGSPRQGVMTSDRGYRDAMPGGPPLDHP